MTFLSGWRKTQEHSKILKNLKNCDFAVHNLLCSVLCFIKCSIPATLTPYKDNSSSSLSKKSPLIGEFLKNINNILIEKLTPRKQNLQNFASFQHILMLFSDFLEYRKLGAPTSSWGPYLQVGFGPFGTTWLNPSRPSGAQAVWHAPIHHGLTPYHGQTP